jgi:hypothetical protein
MHEPFMPQQSNVCACACCVPVAEDDYVLIVVQDIHPAVA